MPRDKAARYRSKESKEGIINAWLSLKNWIKPVFRAIVASKTFSIGTILDEFSRNQTLHYIWGQQAKLTQKIQQSHFFFKSFDMAKSNTTSLLRLHSAVCSQLSGKDWQKKKKKNPQNQFTRKPLIEFGLRSSATSAVYASLCSGWRGWLSTLKTVFSLHSLTRSLLRVMRRQTPERNRDRWEKQKGKKYWLRSGWKGS